jgi:hydroxymethylglutaryl-CoA lyase
MIKSTHTYVECPRDAWQGLAHVIPTSQKVKFLTALLKAGFTNLDCGSFVSPKAMPQMADTEAVLEALPETHADLLCIIANAQGLARAKACGRVTSVGYPLSISDTFQRRNTKRSLEDSWVLVEEIHASAEHLRLVVYLSMGFGNPYGDAWDKALVLESVARLRQIGVNHIVLADTYGQADSSRVFDVVRDVVDQSGTAKIGVHLHAKAENALLLARTALHAGATWLEGAFGGIGGCPFAGDELVGNLPTEVVLPFLLSLMETTINLESLPALHKQALEILG